MKQLNWYQIFGQTHTIPDGSTVTPTDDVQILLNCANIWDKAYTTIADLLSDTASLSAVIVDNNAINYLVRSTTFASSMTADATAMTDIGGDNYASNTLLGDSTWCTAICNSTYFESVLNVKVPTMTSNTTPEGEIIYSGYNPSWAVPLNAFSGAEAMWGYNTGSTEQWLGYRFSRPVKIYMAVAGYTGSDEANRSYAHKVEKSSDGVTWTKLTADFSVTTNSNSIIYHTEIANNVQLCDRYRITGLCSGYGAGYMRKVQFYGREDV